MKRISLVILMALAVVPSALVLTRDAAAQPPAAAPATPSRGTAVFNVLRVMKEYKKWGYLAAEVNKERSEKAAVLAKKQNELIDLQNKMKLEKIPSQVDVMTQQMTVLTRQLEDMEKNARKELDDKSMAHLRQLFGELRQVVDAVAVTNGFELVLAYPDASTAEEMASPIYLDMKLRSQAAMPFYVSRNVDITQVVIETLNKNFPPPAGAVAPAGATVPATPGK